MKHRGIALLMGLVLLAALSLLALLAASGTVLQRNMAANYQEQMLARQNATIAASFAKFWLLSRSNHERQSACLKNCILPAGILTAGTLPPQPEFESSAWWQSNAVAAGFNPETGEVIPTPDNGAEPARWLIEETHYQPTGDERGENLAEGVAYYRILSRGSGRLLRSVAVVENIVARPWDGDFQPGIYPPGQPGGAFCHQFGGRYDCGNLSWQQKR